jgi:hypothetical protein
MVPPALSGGDVERTARTRAALVHRAIEAFSLWNR